MWIIAAALAAVFALSTLPTPLYDRYRDAFGYAPIVTTFIYAAYVVGTVAALFLLGRLSDQIGRKRTLIPAIVATGIAALAFVATNGTAMLFVARTMSGLAIGLSAGAAAAWVGELDRSEDQARIAAIVTGTTIIGNGIGALVAGLLAQYAFWPFRLSYIGFVVVIAVLIVAVRPIRETVQDTQPLRAVSLAPKLAVPNGRTMEFVGPCITNFVIFALAGFYSAITPSLLREGLHVTNAAIGGAIVAEFFFAAIVAIVVTVRVESTSVVLTSLALMLPALALVVLAQSMRSMPLLLICTALGGAATGIGYRGSLQIATALAVGNDRSAVISTFFMFGSAGLALPVLGIGAMTALWSSSVADRTFSIVVAALSIGAFAMCLRARRRVQQMEHAAQA